MKTPFKTYNFSQDNILKNIVNQIVDIADPDKIILFGSRAIGKHKEDSDYDICVLKKNIRNDRKLVRKIRLHLDVFAPIDIVTSTPEKFEKLKAKWFYIYHDIHKFGKIIYER